MLSVRSSLESSDVTNVYVGCAGLRMDHTELLEELDTRILASQMACLDLQGALMGGMSQPRRKAVYTPSRCVDSTEGALESKTSCVVMPNRLDLVFVFVTLYVCTCRCQRKCRDMRTVTAHVQDTDRICRMRRGSGGAKPHFPAFFTLRVNECRIERNVATIQIRKSRMCVRDTDNTGTTCKRRDPERKLIMHLCILPLRRVCECKCQRKCRDREFRTDAMRVQDTDIIRRLYTGWGDGALV